LWKADCLDHESSANETSATLAAAEVTPQQTNPLVEEPRTVHDSPREIAHQEVVRTATVAAPPEPPAETPRRESVPPLQMPRPTRIAGPSFLGLSDESTQTSESDYLLYDDEPERSSWRGWLALAVLALLAFLVYKQWNAVTAGAQMLAQRASEIQQSAAPQKPAPTVSDPNQANNSSQGQPPSGTTPQTPPDVSTAKKDDSVSKPEDDHTTGSAAETKDESASASKDEPAAAASKDESPAASKDESTSTTKGESATKDKNESIAEDTVKPTKGAKKHTADDEDSREATPSKTTTKTTPAEPKFNDAQVEEAQRYLTGHGVRQDCGRAISLLRSSARDGNPRAQVKLGALYATGQCVTQDRAAAYEWLARAQETEPHNSYLQRTMNSLWANMTPEERTRITK
jgi:hypothetical protein